MDNSEDNSKDRVGYFSHAIDRSNLKRGDHIYVYNSWLMYSHHGIYIGNDRVIHFSGGEQSKISAAMVQECSLDEFLNGNQLRLVAYGVGFLSPMMKKSGTCHTKKSRSVKEVLETAENFLKNPQDWGSYNVLTNNCEHFAYNCKTGIKKSAQIEDGLVPNVAITSMMTSITSAAVSSSRK